MSRFLAGTLLLATFVSAQAVPEDSTTHPVGVDSGYVQNTSNSPAAIGVPQVVWSTVVSVPGVAWLRLEYDGVLLSGAADRGGDGSFVRITSLLDGAVQTQHLRHIGEWRDTSAYFNGDSVLVELLAHPNTGENRLIIATTKAGPAVPVQTHTICGPVDDRVLSYDQRVARNQPTGCTSWLINDCNHCFLTAGHCTGNLQVVQFNVPLSNGNGQIQHPPPSEQYAVDASSMQDNGGQGVGDDYAYFGVFANSTTGLTPHQANGGLAFDLVTPPSVGGQNIRITGNGSTSSPVSPTWYLVQKTHSGPYASFTGTAVRYTTDTTGGNSGSPVILDGTNMAIGIHTHGGCTSTGGSNAGTGANHPALQAALANPQGVCDCPGIEFTFPNGLPNFVDPNGATVIRVVVGGVLPLQAGTVEMLMSTGGTFQTIAPTTINATTFDFAVPATTCGQTVQLYFRANDTSSQTWTYPDNAPSETHSVPSAAGLNAIRTFNFNTAPAGWTVSNTSLSTGAWQRGTPVDSRGPQGDADGSGMCWVTGNSNNEDVDGGPTVLRTDTVDLNGTTAPTVRYQVWFDSFNGNTDRFDISASNDGGTNWTLVESITAPTSGWEPRSLDVVGLFGTPNQFCMRFSIADQPNDSVTEGGLDAFRIDDVQCQLASFTSYGTGCAAGGVAPTLSSLSLPNLGTQFVVAANGINGTPTAMVVGLNSTNLPLPAPFAPGCTLLAANDVVQVLNVIGNIAIYSLPIPNLPALDGVQLHVQAATFGSPWLVSEGGVGEIH